MHTIRTHFGGLEVGDNFIHNGVIFKKVNTWHAINMHNRIGRDFMGRNLPDERGP